MKQFYLSTLVLLMLTLGKATFAQDFSNKGKEFWLCFPTHVPSNNNLATLSIYITSDKASTGTITMGNGAFSATFNIPAFGIQQIVIPWNANIHIANGESNTVIRKSIQIKVDPNKPAVVAYAQQWAGARSCATLLLPTTVMGKKYYSMSFTQNGANANPYLARSQFQIIAVKNNTTIRITPRKNGVVGIPFTVSLPLAGDMYQYQSTDAAAATQDLTGTLIESIPGPSGGCVPIAVYSGSSNITFGTPFCSGNSYDPLWQQLYPISSWGKNFGLVPFMDYPNGVPYRVLASEDNTSVFFDGSLVAVLNAGQIYPTAFTSNPPVTQAPINITADKPICVAEYAQADVCTGQPNLPPPFQRVGDPDMVILNPIEQNISDITIFSSSNQAISRQYINVLMKTLYTGTFTINGAPASAGWQAFPTMPGYSYLRQQLPGVGSYRLKADSGFNAIAYGWGNVESYAYSAGTFVKDLYTGMGFGTLYGNASFPGVCVGEGSKFTIKLPYQADSIFWQINQLPGTPLDTMTRYPPSTFDSVTVVNGRNIYWYSLPQYYQFNIPGTYPVTITVFAPNTDGCGSEIDYDFEVEVFAKPIADFTFTTNGCITDSVHFFDNSNTAGRAVSSRYWNFGDPPSGINNTSGLTNPAHLYSVTGPHDVKYSLITDMGCKADTTIQTVLINDPPTALFTATGPYCINQPIIFTDQSTPGATITKWTWDFGDGSPPVIVLAPNPPNQTHTYTAANTYNVTLRVETASGCQSILFTLPVTIQDDGTLTLTSAPSTTNQTVCINTSIVNITYAVGGSSTGGSVTGLPAGVTGVFSGGVITISGTPTVAGVFNYTVSTTGPCINPTATGTITVNDNATITLTSAPGTNNQTVCINTPITTITYAVGGSGTGGSVSGLPAGVTGVFSGGVITISGSPTVFGTFNYTVTTTGPCGTPTATGTITVTAAATINLTSAPGTDNQTVCINTPITNITYAIGGSGSGGSVTGLPAGVNGVFAGGVITISGTPTVSGTFNYTASTTGTCGTASANGTIIVTADGSINLTSAPGTNNQTVCINQPITTITYAISGSTTGASVTGLPAGVNGVFSGGVFTISGSPSVNGTFNYTITTTGPCINPTATGTIIVTNDATLTLTSAPGTDNQTVCINTPITNITYTIGGSASGGNVSGLPAGVNGVFAGGVITISGTPTVNGTFNYTVNTTGPCGTPTANGTIIVNDNTTITLTSAPGTNNQTACVNTAITPITYAVGGGGTGGSVTGLPAGVNGVFAGGVITISGSPTVTGTFNYTVSTTGPCVNPTATGTITVTADATLTLTSAPGTNNQTLCINTAITNITYAVAGSATGVSVTGLPAGVTGNFAGGIVTISGTPTVSGTFNYTVNTTGPCGTPTATGTIIVNDNTIITLTSAPGTNNQTACVNTAITPITYAVGGGGTGGSVTGLPAGVNGVFAGGVITISGSPTVTGTFNYTVSTTGPCVNPTASGTITVTADATLTLTSAPGTNNQTLCINTAITNITYTVAGSATGASVTGLPAGVTGNFAGGIVTISGTPTVSGTFNYTVNTTGPCGTPTATGTITVNDNSTLTLSSGPGSNVQTVCINTAINNITYAIGGGGNGASITAGSLPAGVNGVYSGGVYTISGTPTVSGTFNFTIGTTGPCINTTQSGTITITPDGTLTMTSASGTDNQTVCINTPISNIRYAIGGSSTGASITAGSLPAGVNGVFSGGVFTISGTPTTSGTFNFTVGTTGPCVKPTLAGTITVNPDHAINLSSAASTTNQTVCSDKAIAPIAYTLSGGATGATVTGLPPGVNSSVSGSTLTISGNPAVAGSYNYSIITTGNSCIRTTASGSISVLQTPAVQFNAVPGVCADVPSFQVTATPANGTFSGNGINAAGLFNPAAAGAGDHIIRYTFTAANGCSNYQEQILSVYPKPGINAGPDKFVLEGGTVVLTPALNAGVPVTYSWSPVLYLNNPNISNPLVIDPKSDMTYVLIVTSDKGCTAKDSVFVKLLKAPVIPNIFSPNGDGVHDTWVIPYLESYPGAIIDIYNRYGQIVYHSVNYSKPWDGTVNGKPVPVGTYYYVINPKNGRNIMAGYVDVIR
jgi:gliding motility-associated-like protein